MRIVKTVMALCICMSLFVGGVASAAMLCCVDAGPAEQGQMDNEQVMPCHEHADNTTDQNTDCSGCDCAQCIKMNALVTQDVADVTITEDVQASFASYVYMYQPDGLFQPPKQIS